MPDWLRKTALESAPEMDSMGIESLDQAMDRYGVHDKNISQVEKSTRLHKLILERNEIAERLRPGENHWPNVRLAVVCLKYYRTLCDGSMLTMLCKYSPRN